MPSLKGGIVPWVDAGVALSGDIDAEENRCNTDDSSSVRLSISGGESKRDCLV